jgi:hypothetical protein
MVSKFAVIEYYPDVVRGERANVGVLVWDTEHPERVIGCYLNDLSRVEALAGAPLPLLRDICERADFGGWTAEMIERGMSPMSCLQVRQAGTSILSPENTLDRMAERLLVEP